MLYINPQMVGTCLGLTQYIPTISSRKLIFRWRCMTRSHCTGQRFWGRLGGDKPKKRGFIKVEYQGYHEDIVEVDVNIKIG